MFFGLGADGCGILVLFTASLRCNRAELTIGRRRRRRHQVAGGGAEKVVLAEKKEQLQGPLFGVLAEVEVHRAQSFTSTTKLGLIRELKKLAKFQQVRLLSVRGDFLVVEH